MRAVINGIVGLQKSQVIGIVGRAFQPIACRCLEVATDFPCTQVVGISHFGTIGSVFEALGSSSPARNTPGLLGILDVQTTACYIGIAEGTTAQHIGIDDIGIRVVLQVLVEYYHIVVSSRTGQLFAHTTFGIFNGGIGVAFYRIEDADTQTTLRAPRYFGGIE